MNRNLICCALVFHFLILVLASTANAKNGFDIANSILPIDEILQGGPPKDGIPAIDKPKFISAKQSQLKPRDRVLGLYINDIAKAYPINILNWHEIVNDNFQQDNIMISYCPLCGTGIAFNAKINNAILDFGVSGLLYNSDVLLYDRKTESLWSQILGKAISGDYVNTDLQQVPLIHTTWEDWQTRYPKTTVLSEDTGFRRDYTRNPYADYEQTRQLYFATNNTAPNDYHPKEQVIGIKIKDVAKVYPFAELRKQQRTRFQDKVGDKLITIEWNADANSASIVNQADELLATTTGFWFAWYAFYPNSQVYKAKVSQD